MASFKQRVALLALGHGLNDFVAGYLLGNLLRLHPETTLLAAGFLLYNLLAFGGQWAVAGLLARTPRTGMVFPATMLANGAAVLIFPSAPMLALTLAGIASAFYHVAGGAACTDKGRAAPIGVFAAPGVVGLSLAGYLAVREVDCQGPLLLVLGALLVLFLRTEGPRQVRTASTAAVRAAPLDRHDGWMILLLALITLRSALWNIVQLVNDQQYDWLLIIAGAAAAGKLAGGWIGDRIGWRLYCLLSLLLAFPLVTLFRKELWLFAAGVGLLQSAIPAQTALLIRRQDNPQQSIALSFGIGVLLGGLMLAPLHLTSSATVSFLYFILLLLLTLALFRDRVRQPFLRS